MNVATWKPNWFSVDKPHSNRSVGNGVFKRYEASLSSKTFDAATVGTFLQLSYKSIGSYSPLLWRWTSERTLNEHFMIKRELSIIAGRWSLNCGKCMTIASAALVVRTWEKNSSKYWKIIYQTIKWMVRNSRLKKRQWANRWLQLIRIRRNLGKTLGGVWSTWEQQWGKLWEASPEIKDISSPLTIISGISYYTPEQ